MDANEDSLGSTKGSLMAVRIVYPRYLDDYGDSLGSTSGTWTTTVKSQVYQWYVNKYM